MAKLNFVSGLANGEFATLINNLKKLGALSKSSFHRPVWTSGLQLKLTGFDFVFDEDEMRKFVADNSALSDDELLEKASNKLRVYPVLFTQVLDATTNSWKDYEPLWLKTLLVPVLDVLGDEHTPAGTLNVLAQNAFSSTTTDEATLNSILNATNGKTVVVKRETTITRDYFGHPRNEKLLEFDLKQ
jgi:hypothetical protein